MTAKAKPRSSKSARRTLDATAMLERAGDAATFLKALANDQRLAILCTLLDGPQSVGQINERVELSQSALSQHLAVLRENKLVSTEKEAQTVYYSISDQRAKRLLALLHECFCGED